MIVISPQGLIRERENSFSRTSPSIIFLLLLLVVVVVIVVGGGGLVFYREISARNYVHYLQKSFRPRWVGRMDAKRGGEQNSRPTFLPPALSLLMHVRSCWPTNHKKNICILQFLKTYKSHEELI